MKVHERLFDPHPGLFDPRRSDRTRGRLRTAVLDIVRCPRCQAPLVARMSRRGPCFPCACKNRRERH
jgi:hypothetical protein